MDTLENLTRKYSSRFHLKEIKQQDRHLYQRIKQQEAPHKSQRRLAGIRSWHATAIPETVCNACLDVGDRQHSN